MTDEDRKKQLLADLRAANKRMSAERRRHEQAMMPLVEELDRLHKQLGVLDVSPREIARALGMAPRLAKRQPMRRSNG
jgi:hypothetical protein